MLIFYYWLPCHEVETANVLINDCKMVYIINTRVVVLSSAVFSEIVFGSVKQ